jgi:divalent metal cation (Fe/Co/Zn/Cd) transporter
MVYPFPMLDFLGSGMIGCIELYIAYHLLGSNIKPLLGEGVEDEIYKDIKKIIQENEFIEKVSDLKAVYLSSSQFKVSVHINYNLDVKKYKNIFLLSSLNRIFSSTSNILSQTYINSIK